MLDSVVNNALKKIFKVQSMESISIIRFHFGLLDMQSVFYRRFCKFLLKFLVRPLTFADILVNLQLKHVQLIHAKYGLRWSGTLKCALHDVLNMIRL